MDFFSLAAETLVTPIVLSFVLGLFAALVKSDLSIPEAVAKGMSLYLLFAIGFKGGVSLADHGIDLTLGLTLLAGVLLSAIIPFVAYAVLTRWMLRLLRGTTDRSRSLLSSPLPPCSKAKVLCMMVT